MSRVTTGRAVEAGSDAARGSRRPSALGPPLALVAGGLVALVAVTVPSARWVAALRGADAMAAPELLAGAALLRATLALLGFGLALRFGVRWRRLARSPAAPASAAPAGPRVDLLLLGVLALGAALRLPSLGEGLWLDEVLTLVDHVRLPLGQLVTTYDTENQHFGLTVPAHLAVAVFGESAWALRLPSLVYGVASIAGLYAVGRAAVDRREGLLAATILAVSYHHVWFSQNARGYAGALCFVLLATWLFLRARESGARTRLWVGYAVCMALATWCHLTAVFVAVGHFALQLPRVLPSRRAGTGAEAETPAARWLPLLDGFALAGLLTLALYALVVPQLLALSETSTVAAWRDPMWMLRETLSGLGRGGGGALVGVAALGGVALGGASYLRAGRPEIPVLFALPVTLLAVAGVALGHHLWPRTFFVCAGFAVLLAVRGLVAATEWGAGLLGFATPAARRLGTAAVIAAAAVSAATVPRAWGPKQDYAAARDFVEAHRSPADAVVAVGLARFPYRQLYAPQWRSADTVAELDAIAAAPGRTWVVYTFPQHMAATHAALLAHLERDFEPVRRFAASVGDGEVVVMRERGARAPGERG